MTDMVQVVFDICPKWDSIHRLPEHILQLNARISALTIQATTARLSSEYLSPVSPVLRFNDLFQRKFVIHKKCGVLAQPTYERGSAHTHTHTHTHTSPIAERSKSSDLECGRGGRNFFYFLSRW